MRIRSETLIGREDADLLLDDHEVSRKHAVIRPTEEGFVIDDVGSLNGTLVNNVAVRVPTLLTNGDVIEVGRSEAHVSLQTTQAVSEEPRAAGGTGSVGSYELGEVLRQDGMFTTHKAYQESLDRYVAIKLMNDPGDAEFR
ncbi:MAG: FHA domain-containing protein, partial [Actinomycetota bacterium]